MVSLLKRTPPVNICFKNLIEHEEKAFTVLELVAVIAVLAALTAIALPRFLCVIDWSQAVAARKALTDIQKECLSLNAANKKSNFRQANLNGYFVLSDGSNGCGGASGTSLITAQPANSDKLPVFYLNTSTSEISCSLNGANYASPEDCISQICNQPKFNQQLPNTSLAFGADSGLSCRTVDSASVSIGSGYFYLDGKYDVNLEIQPVIFKAGGESWEVSGVQTKISLKPSDTQWLDDFADALIANINNSDTAFSAEKDISTPGGVLIYTPSGALVDDISMDVSKGVIDAEYNNAGNGTNPWAYPQVGKAKGNSDMPYGVNFVADKSSDNVSPTTICDGK